MRWCSPGQPSQSAKLIIGSKHDKSLEPIAEHLEATEHEWPLPCTVRQLRRDMPDPVRRPAISYPSIDLACITRPAPRRLSWRSYYYTGAVPGEWSTESAMSPAVIKAASRITSAPHLATLLTRYESLRNEGSPPPLRLPVVISWQSRFKAAETIYADYTATTTVGDISEWLAAERPADSIQLAF